jgi:hypothetical protein
MALSEPLVAQASLLFEQRLTFEHNRYVTHNQLKQHDYRLIDSVQLASSQHAPITDPVWLQWLLSNNEMAAADINEATLHSSLPGCLLLLEIKYHRQPEWVKNWVNVEIKTMGQQHKLAWQYAARQQCSLGEFSIDELASAEALWYLGCSGKASHLASVKQLQSSVSGTEPLEPYVAMACYMLGEREDELALVSKLSEHAALNDVVLMLFMAQVSDTHQNSIINYLAAQKSTLQHAIAAMGYSGQLKFVPLLKELAQQADSAEVAANALTILLGVIDADSLIEHKEISLLLRDKSGRKLAGADINSTKLAHVWRSGNSMQRQIAECYRFLSEPGTALRNPNILFGAY